jgi:hypothetical protein
MPEGIPIRTDKGEAETEITQKGADLGPRLPFPPDGVLPEADGGQELEERKLFPRPRGLWIAAATFVPTFLAVFFGVPYLLGGATSVHTAGTRFPGPVVSTPLTSGPDATATPPLPEAALGGTTDGRIGFRAQPPASDLSAMPARTLVQPPVESCHQAKAEDSAVQSPEPSVAGPSLPPVATRVPAPVPSRTGDPRERRDASSARTAEDWSGRLEASRCLRRSRGGSPAGRQHRATGLPRRDPTGSVFRTAVGRVDRFSATPRRAPPLGALVPLLWGDLGSFAVAPRAWQPLDVQAGERGRFPASPRLSLAALHGSLAPVATDRCHLDNSDGTSGAPEKGPRGSTPWGEFSTLWRGSSPCCTGI